MQQEPLVHFAAGKKDSRLVGSTSSCVHRAAAAAAVVVVVGKVKGTGDWVEKRRNRRVCAVH